MKNFISVFLILIVLGFGIYVFQGGFSQESNDNYLRLHIRANSNSEFDQSIKYKVKGAIVNFLTDKVAAASSKQDVVQIINNNLSNIEQVADETLANNGVNYKSSASINNEFFPSRSYEDLVLKEGYYDALIINLGAGVGDNWWCVVYPPLCFVGATPNGTNNIRYKSIFKTLFDNILQ